MGQKPLRTEFQGEYYNGKAWNGTIKEYRGKNLIFEGKLLNGEKNGIGKKYDEHGKLKFEGEYKDGKILKGKEFYDNCKIKFEGEYKEGKRLRGKEFYDNGKLKFEGEYKEGNRLKGKEFNICGNYLEFEGLYLNEKRNGPGKEYYYNNGELKFVGKYLNGERNGPGKEYYKKDNLKYEGEFLDGKRNGKGKEFHQNGKLRFEVEYLNGEINGKIKEYYDNGVLKIDGEYLNGKLYGKVREFYSNGNLKFDGEYLNGKKYGKIKSFYESGNLEFDGEYLNGEKNGKVKEYDKNGNLNFEGEYSNGKRWNGKGKEYDKRNRLNFEGEYSNGKRNGHIKEYYENERLRFEGEYLNGKKWNGKGYNIHKDIIEFELINGNARNVKEYDSLGRLEFEGEYIDGERCNGKEIIYQKTNGKIYKEKEYLIDRVKEKKFYENGQLKSVSENFFGKIKPKNESEFIKNLLKGIGQSKIKGYYENTHLYYEGEFLNKKGQIKIYYKNGQPSLESQMELLMELMGEKQNYEEEDFLRFSVDSLNIRLNIKGTAKIYLENGQLGFEAELLKGNKFEGKVFNKSGKLKIEIEAELLNEQKDKENIKIFDPKDISHFFIDLLNGKLKGKITEKIYYESGKIRFEGEFLNGEIKTKRYFEDGNIQFEYMLDRPGNNEQKKFDENDLKRIIETLKKNIENSYEFLILSYFLKLLISGENKENDFNVFDDCFLLVTQFILELIIQEKSNRKINN